MFKYLFWDLYRFLYAFFTFRSLKVSREIREQRLDICKNCEKLVLEERSFFGKKLKPQPRCGICTCFLNLKTWFAPEECPDEPPKWTSVE